ncbi:MAG TPA: zinc-ribbon domain-containing protein [Candidatus Bathyarchaeia archaeon]|nr:zinc-ribbon domain-containing protein [Candidatus Bathyarchaeia archaeon]
MPYCRKCGAKLEEEARFCHVCGTPVAAVTTPAMPRRRPFLFPVIILIAILVTAVVVSALAFLPVYPVHFDQTNQVAKAGVDNLILDFQADVAQVNVFFMNLPDKMVVLNVTADGYVGIFDDPNRTINVTFDHQTATANNTKIVTSRVSRATLWPFSYNLHVVCNVFIDPSANLSLVVHSGVGQIMLNVDAATTIQSLNLETTTGNIDASVAQGVVITGTVSAKTTTGSVTFNWMQADTEGNVSVNLKSTTGTVNLSVARNSRLSGNVSIEAGTTTGSVNLAMAIYDDVGAKIESHTSVGGINVEQQGFSGDQSLLQSSNYPAGSNFLVNLATTTGGVHINAYYESSAVFSAWQTR